MKIAIVGSGITGLGAAYALSDRYGVKLFEKNTKFGGHSNTVDIQFGGKRLLLIQVLSSTILKTTLI
jgi:predicted NAD/FAD-binding protein